MARNVADQNTEFAGGVDLLDTAMRQLRIRQRVELPPVIDFVEHPALLNSDRLYPRQKTLLKLMCLETESMTAYDIDVINEWADGFYRSNNEQMGVSPDVWKRIEILKERGYQQFGEVVNISGRRGSKGHLGGIMGARQNYRLIKASDPQLYYGIAQGKEVYLYVTATTQAQAMAYQFSDLARTILNGPCFRPYIFASKPTFITLQTDADRMRAAELKRQGVQLDKPIASIVNIALSANSAAARGGAGFGAFFDEMAHMIIGTAGPRTAEAVYKAIVPSLGQVGIDGFIYIPTSPLTKTGQAYTLAQQALAVDDDGLPQSPTMLLIQLPSWFSYEDWDDPKVTQGHTFVGAPERYDEAAREFEQRDPETFKVEKKAQWAEVVDAYLPPQLVDTIFNPIIDPNTGEPRVLRKQEFGVLKWIYRGHADPAEKHDNFAMAICHSEPIRGEDGEIWDHVFLDWIQVWKPTDFENGLIDYATVEEEMAEAIMRFPALQVFSYDQWGSFVTVGSMRDRLARAGKNVRVKEVTFTASSNRKRFEDFRSAMGMGWVHAYKDTYGPENTSLLELELKFLQRTNDRIDHPKVGPVRTKDAVDAFMVAATELLGDNLERLHKRRALGSMPLQSGAQGGYHTNPEAEMLAKMSPARQRLAQNSRRQVNRKRSHGGY